MTSAGARPELLSHDAEASADTPAHRWARMRGAMSRCSPGGLLRGENGSVLTAVIAGCVAVSLAAAGYGGFVTVQTASDNAVSFSHAHAALGANIRTLQTARDALVDSVSAAREVLAASQAKVLDYRVLVDGEADLTRSDSAVAKALATQSIAVKAHGGPSQWFDSGRAQIKAGNIVSSAIITVRASEVASEATCVRIGAAVAAWSAEQARIATVALAAAQSQSQAQAQAVAAVRAKNNVAAKTLIHRTAATFTAVPPVSDITVNVRTVVHATSSDNGQVQIDQGGEVAIDWGGHGTIVSAHNRNDARALRLTVGERVTFTGAVSGTYIVTGAITVRKGDSVSVLDSLGVKMFMQTCYFTGGQMRIVGLRPA